MSDNVEETKEVVTEEKEEKFDKLSNREALEKAVKVIEEREPEKEAPALKKEDPKVAATSVVSDDVEPPAEFNAAERKAWKDKDIQGIQKAYRRIHDARTQEISRSQAEAKKAREDAAKETQTYRTLAEKLAPYIKAQGDTGKTPEEAMTQAVALVYALKGLNPAQVRAELKGIGIDLDKSPEESGSSSPKLEKEISTLQESVKALAFEREQEKLTRIANTFDAAFDTLRAQKTRSGEPVFPDLHDKGDDGMELARRIGSRTRDPFFQKRVLARFPQADFTVLVREAYIAEYGKVSGDPVQVSPKKTQEHLEKARRAAAVSPGKPAPRADSSSLVGKLSRRQALEKALEEREH